MISGEFYVPIFFNLLLILHIGLVVKSFSGEISENSNLRRKRVIGILLIIFSVFFIGFRPVSGQYFGDMSRYSMYYWDLVRGYNTTNFNDVGFLIFFEFTTIFNNNHIFFFLACILYIYPLYLVSKKLFGSKWYYSFLILISSFSFFSYGTNGIRNGIATSIMLYALANGNKKIVFGIFALLALSFHKSMLLVIMAYVVTLISNNNKWILLGWVVSIPISLVMSGFWESFFAEHIITDDKATNYLLNKGMDYIQTNIGFRWDFITYSATGVLTGWYFIFRKKFKDKLYSRLFNIYLICNAVWILIIKVPFSNRFAYLSWFMLGLIIVYPFLKENLFKTGQHSRLALVLTLYFSFTYFMNIILG